MEVGGLSEGERLGARRGARAERPLIFLSRVSNPRNRIASPREVTEMGRYKGNVLTRGRSFFF
jgi:hypothetical protein